VSGKPRDPIAGFLRRHRIRRFRPVTGYSGIASKGGVWLRSGVGLAWNRSMIGGRIDGGLYTLLPEAGMT